MASGELKHCWQVGRCTYRRGVPVHPWCGVCTSSVLLGEDAQQCAGPTWFPCCCLLLSCPLDDAQGREGPFCGCHDRLEMERLYHDNYWGDGPTWGTQAIEWQEIASCVLPTFPSCPPFPTDLPIEASTQWLYLLSTTSERLAFKHLTFTGQIYSSQISLPFLLMSHNDDGIPSWVLALRWNHAPSAAVGSSYVSIWRARAFDSGRADYFSEKHTSPALRF